MNFFEIPERQLPDGAQYYFNVLVINCAVTEEDRDEFFPEGVMDIWYLERINEARPKAYHFYLEGEETETDGLEFVFLSDDEEEYEFEADWEDDEEDQQEEENLDLFCVELFPHSVIEVHPTLGVSFYDMMDFDTSDLWSLD